MLTDASLARQPRQQLCGRAAITTGKTLDLGLCFELSLQCRCRVKEMGFAVFALSVN